MAGTDDQSTTGEQPAAEAGAALDTGGAPAAAETPWFLDPKIDWTSDNSINAAMARGKVEDGEHIAGATMQDVYRAHGDLPEGEGGEDAPNVEADPAADPAAKPDPDPAVAPAAPAAPAVDPAATITELRDQLEALRQQVEGAKAAPAAPAAQAQTQEQITAAATARAAELASLVEELGEGHPVVKAVQSLHKQTEAVEKQLLALQTGVDKTSQEAFEAREAKYHQFQLGKHKILADITAGAPLDPEANPQSAWAASLSRKYTPLVAAGKMTREQLYEKVEEGLKAAYPELAKKHYAPAAPAKPAARTAPAGVQSLSELPEGRSTEVVRGKGIAELNPRTMSPRDFDALMDSLTR